LKGPSTTLARAVRADSRAWLNVCLVRLTNDEGCKRLSIVRRGSGSVVRWRRAQIVLWSAQRMNVPAIAKIAISSRPSS
jgi:hypothetical protein